MKTILLYFLLLWLVPPCMAQTPTYDENKILEESKKLYDFSSWPGKGGPVQPAVNLVSMIPLLNDAPEVRYMKDMVYGTKIDDTYVMERVFTWKYDDSTSVSVRFGIASTCDDAHEFLVQRLTFRTNPALSRRDEPPVAGDISFDKGYFFIKRNIAVDIYASGRFKNSVSEIARQIDAALATQPTFDSDALVKPVVTFELIKTNRLRSVQVVPFTKDPLGGQVYSKGLYRNGVESYFTENDKWYYTLYQPGSSVLTLLFVNDAGFHTVLRLNFTATDTDIFGSLRGE